MTTRHSIFLRPSFLMSSICTANRVNADAGRTLPGYSIIAAAVLLFTLLFSSPQAFAATTQSQFPNKPTRPLSWSCGNPNSGHCYGVQLWGGANGADTRISLHSSLNGGGTNNDQRYRSFVTTEMWLQTANGAYWVEAGIDSHYFLAGTTYPFYFWGDNRPNGGGFSFHYLASEGCCNNALVRITRSGSSNWNVLVADSNSSHTGTSTFNNISIGNIAVGTELYNNFSTAVEPTILYTNNRWSDSHGNFHYQGGYGTGTSVRYPVAANWYLGQDPPNSRTGGVWYSCIPGHGC